MQKISIVTPSFNQGRYIRQTIESVLAQQYPVFEHIVIDGGSTDETVGILKEYPHLRWISEPDNGQSDALNKGFAMADGDIVGWINSDDWYADGVFGPVADALSRHPIVSGACELRDESGRTMYVVPNKPRTWFDLLKYWVPYSIPAQPSIFMRRELLELAKRPDGAYFDQELFYCMDYDLWLRLCQHAPFSISLGRILSYYRMTSDNKTGQKTEGMPYAEPEMSRLFNRYKDAPFEMCHPLTVIIVARSADEARPALESLGKQDLQLGEVIVAPFGDCDIRRLRDACAAFNAASRERRIDLYSRVCPVPGMNAAQAVNRAANLAEGSIVAVLEGNCPVACGFSAGILSYFSRDSAGFMDLKIHGGSFAARKVCLLETDGLEESDSLERAAAVFGSSCAASGWR